MRIRTRRILSPSFITALSKITANFRAELEKKGCVFTSETDTETIAHLITDYLRNGMTPQQATAAALKRLAGAFAIGIIFADHDELLIGARRGSPLALGYGDGEMFLGSDALALAPHTGRITYLEEGDWAELYTDKIIIHDAYDKIVERKILTLTLSDALTGKGQYRHFMLKEIFEQPTVIGDTLSTLFSSASVMDLPPLPFNWKKVPRLTIVACGTASYAGLVAKYWFEQLAKLPVEIDIASEFRYREAPMPKGGVTIVVSQSGETADTLAALHYAKSQGQKILSIVNVAQSSIARASDVVVPTMAGPEIGVASTKAFTTQLTVLLCLALSAAQARKTLTPQRIKDIMLSLREVPAQINAILRDEHRFRSWRKNLAEARTFFIWGAASLPDCDGRRFKAQGNLVHPCRRLSGGRNETWPHRLDRRKHAASLFLRRATLYEKTASNIQEVVARGGKVILFSDKSGVAHIGIKTFWSMACRDATPSSPLLYVIPVQLLAYYTAIAKGTDVDQPRNLAKSVTVE